MFTKKLNIWIVFVAMIENINLPLPLSAAHASLLDTPTNFRKRIFRPEKVPALFLTAENANEADDDNLDLQNQVAELFPASGAQAKPWFINLHQFTARGH